MPRFLAYCPDYPNSLERRMAVRPAHLVDAKPDIDSGVQIIGAGFLPRPGTAARANPTPKGTMNLAGSYMILRFDSLEEYWARLKRYVYWTEGVWDKERLSVEELIGRRR